MVEVGTRHCHQTLFNIRKIIFKLTLVNDDWGISYEIALRRMPQGFTDDKSTLVQVMAWCHQATSHYLSQCWPRSMSPNWIAFVKAPVTLSRLDRRPFPTWMVGRGLVKSCGSRERTGMGLGRSWEVGELGRGVPDYSRLFWTVQNDREWSGIKSSLG